MKCIILAAGYATRLYPLTENFPKPLLKVKDKAILDWLVDDIDSLNKIDEFVIVSNNKFAHFFRTWKGEKNLSAKLSIIDDGTTCNENRLGAVSDIELAIETLNIDDDVMVIAGDNVLDFSFDSFIKFFEEKNATSIMCYFEENKEKIKKSASVVFDENRRVSLMVEKPQEPPSNYCVPPFYIYAKKDVPMIKEALEKGCNKDAPGSLINWLFDKTDIYAMEMPGRRYDIGNLESYKKVNEEFNP